MGMTGEELGLRLDTICQSIELSFGTAHSARFCRTRQSFLPAKKIAAQLYERVASFISCLCQAKWILCCDALCR
jgi:hypothetical protein